jgi:HK97 family phage major capsid protein
MPRRISDHEAPSMHGATQQHLAHQSAVLNARPWKDVRAGIPADHPRNDGATATAGRDQLVGDIRKLTTKIAAASEAAGEAWAKFEDARVALAGTDDATNQESEAYKNAQALGEAFTAAKDEVERLQGARNGLMEMAHADGPAAEGNGPQDGGDPGHGDALPGRSTRQLSESAGDIALRSTSYKELKANGAFTVNERKSVDVVLVRRAESSNQRMADTIRAGRSAATLVTGSDSSQAGALIEPDRQPGILGITPRELRLVDMITVGTTDSDSVDFVVQRGGVNNAAEVAEATAVDGTSGTKPLSSIDLTKEKFDVVTIAHAIAATKRALSDAGQLRTLIEQFLSQGLDERLDGQIAAGNGQGENIRGIVNTPGIAQVVGRAAKTGNTNTPELPHATIFRALMTVAKARFRATAIGMSIEDWAMFVLWHLNEQPVANQAGTAGAYGKGGFFMGGPVDIPNQRMWGRPVILSEAFPVGGPIVGDYTKAALWLREGTQIMASDSHEDFFLRNMVAILAEFRAAFGVIAPAAFCQADISAWAPEDILA